MINDITLNVIKNNSDDSKPTDSPIKDDLPNKTSYFGFKMTMSNTRLSLNAKEESEYSMADSPLFPENKNELNL
jgi:hypothetical protein